MAVGRTERAAGPGDQRASSRRARRGRGEEGWGAVSMGAVSTPTGSWSFLPLTKLSFQNECVYDDCLAGARRMLLTLAVCPALRPCILMLRLEKYGHHKHTGSSLFSLI